MTIPPLNVRLPTPFDRYDAQNERETRRQIELSFSQIQQGGGTSATADGIFAVEAHIWNNGSTLAAGDSEWVEVPTGFTITGAEIVGDPAGTMSVEVYSSTYATWPTFTKITGSAPITLTGANKNRPSLSGWTTSFSGATYLRFTITGTPAFITKATITLTLSIVNAGLADLTDAVYAAAINRANHTGTQLASTISDFNSAARAQTEAELVAGSNITITPGSSGATRTLTLASTASGSAAESRIDRQTPSGTASVTLTPSGSYNHLRIYVHGRSDAAGVSSVNLLVQVNGDTTANYDMQLLEANNASAYGSAATATTSMQLGYVPAATATASLSGSVEVTVPDYSGTTFKKVFRSHSALPRTSNSATGLFTTEFTGSWRSTAAITSITVSLSSGNWVAGSSVSLYGIT